AHLNPAETTNVQNGTRNGGAGARSLNCYSSSRNGNLRSEGVAACGDVDGIASRSLGEGSGNGGAGVGWSGCGADVRVIAVGLDVPGGSGGSRALWPGQRSWDEQRDRQRWDEHDDRERHAEHD